jgi:uroporphyrinogen-III synthase
MARRTPVVLSTRDEAGNARFAEELAAMGGRTLSLPLIRIEPPRDPGPLRAAVAALDRFDWVVFTSAHAVDATCTLGEWQFAWRAAVRPRIAAVGPATARALRDHGIADVITAGGTARALVELLGGRGVSNVLWPRSDRARRELPDGLRAAGATIVDPIAYRTCLADPDQVQDVLDKLEAGAIDAVAFFSPSAVHACVETFGDRPLSPAFDRVLVASIGPTTTAAAADAGLCVDVEADDHTARGLSRAIMTRLAAVEGVRA